MPRCAPPSNGSGIPRSIKPAAGGGGIGMKVARHANDIAGALTAARREARASFGDDTLYVERLIERPRHVEIQVFADAHGNTVHLFERECSAQRRHQKTIEESPCAALSAAVRERMGAAAIAAAKAVGYRNAGTCEFLLEGSGDTARFYFLEMNTRLQVEHPVTEAVVGVDLVHAQLRVASGEPLPFTQAALSQRGHAIECRVYAEDPAQGFLPQAGTVLLYSEPQGPGIRVDGWIEGRVAGVRALRSAARQADRVGRVPRCGPAPRDYRAYATTPSSASGRTSRSCIQMLEHPDFVNASIDTGWLDREGARLLPKPRSVELPPAALAAVEQHRAPGTRTRPLEPLEPLGPLEPLIRSSPLVGFVSNGWYLAKDGDRQVRVAVATDATQTWVFLNGRVWTIERVPSDGGRAGQRPRRSHA